MSTRAVADLAGWRAAARVLAGLAVVFIVVACSGAPAQSAGATAGGPVNGGGSPGPRDDWRSYKVCQIMPGEEAAALLGVTADSAAPADPSSPSSCHYTFSGAGPAELTISLNDAAAFAARYNAATNALDESDDVELREFFGLFDEAFATSTPDSGVEIWVRKGEAAAVFMTSGKVDDHKEQLIALARALLGKL